MGSWIDDASHAWRRLRHRPALTMVAIATLALGLGANIAIFTLIHAVAIQPLPVQSPGQLYRLGADSNCCVNSGVQTDYSLFSYDLYSHLRDQVTEFESLAGFQAQPQAMTVRRAGANIAESAFSEYVSANYFQTLGVAPATGRLLEAADDRPGADPVFVMSHRVWRDQFGADPSLVGASFVLAGVTMTLAGVADEAFFGETRRPYPPGVFLPLGMEPRMRGTASLLGVPSQDWLRIIGRLPETGRLAVAQTQADTALRQWLSSQTFPRAEEREGLASARTPIVSASSGVETLRMTFQAPLKLLFVMSGLVLLIAVANLANLLIAHSDRGKTAIRVALGASPQRLVRQAVSEGVVLSLLGAAAGVLVAAVATRLIVAVVFPAAMAAPVDVTPSALILLFAVGLAIATGVLFSAAPAMALLRTDPIEALRGAGRGGQARSFLPRRSLVIVQVALSLVLLTGAGLLGTSLRQLQQQPLKFETTDRVVVRLDLPTSFAGDIPRLTSVYSRLREEFGRIPGVRNVTYSLYSPMEGNNWSSGISIDGRPDPDRRIGSSWNRVGPGYFDTLGTKVIRGRAPDARDTPSAPMVAVVNETFVTRYFEAEEPIGRRLGIGGPANARDFEIVGVVEDVKYTGADQPTRPMIFLPDFQIPAARDGDGNVMARSTLLRAVSVHATTGAGALEPQFRQAVARVDPNVTVVRVLSMADQVAGNFRMNRLLSGLTSAYGLLALALAFLGLYAVTSSTVARRTREIGIRMALGADRKRVIRDVVRDALGHTVGGLIVGIPIALMSTGTIAALLYSVQPRDPFVIGGAALVLLVSTVVAAAVPARRASRVEPTRALRNS
jgi:macrolide transport system ATP-binding/permease protein